MYQTSPLSFVLFAVILSLAIPRWSAAEPPMTDDVIRRAVETALLQGEGFSDQSIEVAVKDGVATLTGQVGSLLAKRRAERLAQAVRSVGWVRNRLEVEAEPRPDAKIRTDVISALQQDPVTRTWQIDVEVNDGMVTLRGDVDSYLERQLAESVATRIRGVRGIVNLLVVEPPDRRDDAAIRKDAEARLFRDRRIQSGLISIEVEDGIAQLKGFVRSAWEKEEAQRKVREIEGVKGVVATNLKVAPEKRAGMRPAEVDRLNDAQLKQTILDEFRYHPRIIPSEINVHVEGGVVTLTGVVDNLQAKTAAETEAQRVMSVARVENYLQVRPRDQSKTDQQIAEDVRQALRRDALVNPEQITVLVDNRRVRLIGEVASEFSKLEAEHVASYVDGVQAIVNELKLPRLAGGRSDREIRRDIERELWWSPFVDSERIHVRVEDGVATLRGTVEDFDEKDAALKNAWEGGAVKVRDLLDVAAEPELDALP